MWEISQGFHSDLLACRSEVFAFKGRVCPQCLLDTGVSAGLTITSFLLWLRVPGLRLRTTDFPVHTRWVQYWKRCPGWCYRQQWRINQGGTLLWVWPGLAFILPNLFLILKFLILHLHFVPLFLSPQILYIPPWSSLNSWLFFINGVPEEASYKNSLILTQKQGGVELNLSSYLLCHRECFAVAAHCLCYSSCHANASCVNPSLINMGWSRPAFSIL